MEPGPIALVSYIPGPLAGFLNSLRQELTPESRPRAHVTILPPWHPGVAVEAVRDRVEQTLTGFPAFAAELGTVQIFPGSNVIYLELRGGAAELRFLNQRLNRGSLWHESAYSYHPHVTLAQGLSEAEARAALPMVRRRWDEYAHRRTLEVDQLTLVQQLGPQQWADLCRISLAQHELVACA